VKMRFGPVIYGRPTPETERAQDRPGASRDGAPAELRRGHRATRLCRRITSANVICAVPTRFAGAVMRDFARTEL
jgi:hypothetical protein